MDGSMSPATCTEALVGSVLVFPGEATPAQSCEQQGSLTWWCSPLCAGTALISKWTFILLCWSLHKMYLRPNRSFWQKWRNLQRIKGYFKCNQRQWKYNCSLRSFSSKGWFLYIENQKQTEDILFHCPKSFVSPYKIQPSPSVWKVTGRRDRL